MIEGVVRIEEEVSKGKFMGGLGIEQITEKCIANIFFMFFLSSLCILVY